MSRERPRHGLLRQLLLPVLLAVAMAACTAIMPPEPEDPVYDNPQDPSGSEFEPPQTTITTGPADGATVGTREVTFEWTGNQAGMLFQARLDGSDWSPWDSSTTLNLTYLDEQSHTFEVRSGYATGTAASPTLIDETPATVTFTVDAVTSSSLRFSPPLQTAGVNEGFTLYLYAEEINDLMLVATTIRFDPNHLTVLSLTEGGFLTSTEGSLVTYNSFDNLTGTIEVNMATATGSPPGVSGTGVLLAITFRAKTASESSVYFDGGTTYFRDHLNRAITVNELVPALVRAP